MSKESKYADKTKIIFSGTSTVADVEARMQKVLEEVVIPLNDKWDKMKKENKNIQTNYNTPKPYYKGNLG